MTSNTHQVVLTFVSKLNQVNAIISDDVESRMIL